MKRNCAAALMLAASASAQPAPLLNAGSLLESLLPTPLLLLGEQHDAPEHQTLQREVVQALAARGQLAAVVMEMLEQGRQTSGLDASADESLVRSTLAWTQEDRNGWSWRVYGPVVMAAVRAGVPVVGGNLPRERMREAMADASLDSLLPEAALQQQREAIREGHCGLLPQTQIAPMTRIQLARDKSLASSALAQLSPGKTVVLVAGNGHVRRDLGVPQYLPPAQAHRVVMALAGPPSPQTPSRQADALWHTPPVPAQDHCAALKKQMGR